MATWVTLNGATQWALQLDGVITRTGRTTFCYFIYQQLMPSVQLQPVDI